MPLSDGTKAIATNPAWASATTKGSDPTDDRIDPDDSSLTPPIVIADGWPDSFSTAGGNTPRRAVWNELEFRKDSAIKDIINYGILPWDTDVDTLEGGVKQVNGVVYRADVNNGPTYSNATDPTTSGQTVWETVSGSVGVPNAPDMPSAVADNGTLDWSWSCPLDNGAAVTAFDFQWRQSGQQAWSASITVTSARYLLTGLTNGQAYEARVLATNSQGDSPFGAEGTGTPVAAVPGGGNTLALRADTGDDSGEADLEWLEPADNGAPITGYTYQWKSGGQSFNNSRQGTTTSTSVTVPNLADGTEYDFRVRATNSVGSGPWSNEDSATPEAPVTPPVDSEPGQPTNHEGAPRRPLIVDWTWEVPDSNGGQRIENYDHQWRYQGSGWGNTITTEGAYRRITVADTSTSVQARVRARNSVGTSSWASTVTVQSSDLLDSLPQRVRLTTDQTYSYPFNGPNAVMHLVGSGTLTPSADASMDICAGYRHLARRRIRRNHTVVHQHQFQSRHAPLLTGPATEHGKPAWT